MPVDILYDLCKKIQLFIKFEHISKIMYRIFSFKNYYNLKNILFYLTLHHIWVDYHKIQFDIEIIFTCENSHNIG